MKKQVTVVMMVLFMLFNVLCVNASETLEQYEETLKGKWKKLTAVEIGGVEHSLALSDDYLELPNSNIILTEDSNGLVYLTAIDKENKTVDIPTMGIVTLSSDNNTMVIKDQIGGILIYTRKK